jgi:hypothetical protein
MSRKSVAIVRDYDPDPVRCVRALELLLAPSRALECSCVLAQAECDATEQPVALAAGHAAPEVAALQSRATESEAAHGAL